MRNNSLSSCEPENPKGVRLMPAYSHAVAINPSPGKGEITVLFSGESQTRASHKVGPQLLDYYLLHFVTSGKGSFYSMGKGYEIGAGSSFIIFSGRVVQLRIGSA